MQKARLGVKAGVQIFNSAGRDKKDFIACVTSVLAEDGKVVDDTRINPRFAKLPVWQPTWIPLPDVSKGRISYLGVHLEKGV
jgi:hypothetical protein